MNQLRRADLPTPPPGSSIDEASLEGSWRNADTHAEAPAIRSAELSREQGCLRLSMIGVDDFEWGSAAVENVFAGSSSSTQAVGFTATFELGGRHVRIHANIKLGVMVLAGFMRFDDSSGRPPSFTRDFLYLVDDLEDQP